MKFPLHPDFNDRDVGTCDRCGALDLLYPDIPKKLCLTCWQALFRSGGIIPYLETTKDDPPA